MEDDDEDEDGNELRRRKPGDKYRKEVEKEVERFKVKVGPLSSLRVGVLMRSLPRRLPIYRLHGSRPRSCGRVTKSVSVHCCRRVHKLSHSIPVRRHVTHIYVSAVRPQSRMAALRVYGAERVLPSDEGVGV